jgi:Zn-dependent protease
MGLTAYDLRMAAINVIILVASFIIHEWGHAIVADKLGDDTPRSQGRVTLNPLVHIDPFGSIILPVIGALGMMGGFLIGWAKPVLTNPANFRRGHFDQVLVALAGPGMNVVLATVGAVGAAVANRMGLQAAGLMHQIIAINVMLIVINMLPIPPLDGSRLLLLFGVMRDEAYARFSMFGGFILLAILILRPTRAILFELMNLVATPFRVLELLLS